MHGDSLLMLTTKVVSNKKPPLLSDSESGGSTSLNSPNIKSEQMIDFMYRTFSHDKDLKNIILERTIHL